MDDAIHTTAIHDDDWEAALVAKANGDVPDDEDCGDEEEGADEEEPPACPTLSARDAMSSVKDLLDFARGREGGREGGGGGQIEVFKILNGYENIDSNIFFQN